MKRLVKSIAWPFGVGLMLLGIVAILTAPKLPASMLALFPLGWGLFMVSVKLNLRKGQGDWR